MKPLDNLCHPVSVIREAEQLAAEAFRAAHAFLMVGGHDLRRAEHGPLRGQSGGKRLILPRNVHRSVMGAMVLCGAIPVYVNPECDDRLGIPLGMSVSAVEKAIRENPDAKAVLVNNPTYYGICSDLRTYRDAWPMRTACYCLADEAHGTHFYFGEGLCPSPPWRQGPIWPPSRCTSPAAASRRVPCCSTGPAMQEGHVRQIINLTQTTSASYLLLSSLDISRRNLALRGRDGFRAACIRLAEYARERDQRASAAITPTPASSCNGDSVLRFRCDEALRQHARRRPGGHRGLRPAAR